MEWQSHIHKAHVLVALIVGVFHHIPHHHRVGVEHMECLAPKGRIPQVGIAFAIHHSGTGYHLLVILGYKQVAIVACHQLAEEDIIGDIAFGFQQMVLVQQIGKCLEIGFVAHFLGVHAAFVGVVDAALQFLGDALFGRPAMQRIVYRHPV